MAERCAAAARSHGFDIASQAVERVLPGTVTYLLQAHHDDPDLWSSDGKVRRLWLDYYLEIFRRLGVQGETEACAATIYEEYGRPGAWALYPDVLPVLSALHDREYLLGVISDWSSDLPGQLIPLGLGRYIDFVVVSTIQREAKPGMGLYREALARTGVRPAEAIHVGDNYVNDILGARSAGIRGVLLDRECRHLGPLDCPRITSLEELPELLAGWSRR